MKMFKLRNGLEMPAPGFGSCCPGEKPEVTVESVCYALQCGYSHVDGAAIYKNEKEVGLGIKKSGVKREDIFITSKLWNNARGYDQTIAAFEKTCSDLGVDYLDQYLIHWPVPKGCNDTYVESNKETWRAMEDLYEAGRIKSIGVSNFKIHHLEELLESAKIVPMVNQIEFHPSCLHHELRGYCKKLGIQITGYSPFGNGRVFRCEELKPFPEKYGVSLAQICIQYAIQHDVIPLAKSITNERIKKNLELDFVISDEDMQAIDAITSCESSLKDSDNIPYES
ncbi:aldo/keto reductase family protein [Tannockella kyphosi]|uniref:aldo/keto reductase family protein n=1 Tax=Tannockella kyphosi TaxID=2899121 RepID=UPI0020134926|nr:aldo/keto reductase [Tannockella kyphosi]